MSKKFQRLVNNPFLFRLYLLKSLPLAFIAGIRVSLLDERKAVTRVRYGWLTQNPFRSMYFACQAMAAEMSTGLLVMNYIYGLNPGVSMLIISSTSTYHKKAVGKITFTCDDGTIISEEVSKVLLHDERAQIVLRSQGKDESGDVVAEFSFTWSLRRRAKF